MRGRKPTHGKRFTRTYRIWRAMKQRCTQPLQEHYADYGGRGVTVCQRWADSFEAFFADMGECEPGMSIDRFPDQDGNYEPGNCRWATQKQQCRNKRNNRRLTFDGKTMTVIEWAESTGLSAQTLYKRIYRGLPVERVLAVPKDRLTGAPS